MSFAIETLGIHFQDQKYSNENIQTIEIDGHRDIIDGHHDIIDGHHDIIDGHHDIIDGHRWIIDPNHTPYTLIQNRASNYFVTGYDKK
jgi:hypothetical protein